MTDETKNDKPEEATDKSVDKGEFVAPESGNAPTATAYLGNDEWTGTEPILQGSPYYHNGRLITTQEELDAIRKEFDEYAKNDENVVNPGGDPKPKK